MQNITGLEDHKKLQKYLEGIEAELANWKNEQSEFEKVGIGFRWALEYILDEFKRVYPMYAEASSYDTLMALQNNNVINKAEADTLHQVRKLGNKGGAHLTKEESSYAFVAAVYDKLLDYIPSFITEIPDQDLDYDTTFDPSEFVIREPESEPWRIPPKQIVAGEKGAEKLRQFFEDIDYSNISDLKVDSNKNWYGYYYCKGGIGFINRKGLVKYAVERCLNIALGNTNGRHSTYPVPGIIQEYLQMSCITTKYDDSNKKICLLFEASPKEILVDYYMLCDNVKLPQGLPYLENIDDFPIIVDEFDPYRKKTITLHSYIGLDHGGIACFRNTETKIIHAPYPAKYTIVDGDIYSNDMRVLYYKGNIAEPLNFDKRLKVLGNECFKNSNITEITIPEGVMSIERDAFYLCRHLKKVSLPKTLKKIGKNAFLGCCDMENITFNLGLEEIEDDAFVLCSHLKSVTFPSTLKKIGRYAFGQCYALENVNIKRGIRYVGPYAFKDSDLLKLVPVSTSDLRPTYTENPNYVKYINGVRYSIDYKKMIRVDKDIEYVIINEKTEAIAKDAFLNSAIKAISIPNNVTSIEESAFSGCSNLEELVIPDSVTNIGRSAFSGCSSLEKIVIPDSVTSIRNSAFRWCSSLEELVIPDSVTSIGSYAFSECDALKKVIIGNRVKYIGDSAFNKCSSLEKIVIPDSVTSIGESAFSGCSRLEELVIPDNVKSIGEYAFRWCSSLEELVIPDSVTSIGNRIFSGCSALKKVVIHADIEEPWHPFLSGCDCLEEIVIGRNCYTENFKNCMSLKKVIIGEGVKYIGRSAFYKCSSLEEIVISDSVTNINETAFYKCTSLKKVTIGDGVKFIWSDAFSGCSSLEELVIPDSVTSIRSHAFSECDALKKVIIGNRVKYIGDSAFNKCSSLEKIVIPDSVTSIGESAFSGCSSLEELVIHGSVTNIENFAFSRCSSLKELVIPDSVTSIGKAAFSGCSSLKELVIPDSVMSIGDHAFYKCSSLERIVILNGIVKVLKELKSPNWFEKCEKLKEILTPDHIVLTDAQGRVKEISYFEINDHKQIRVQNYIGPKNIA